MGQKGNKWKVLLAVAAVVALAFAFWYGGGAPGSRGWTVSRETASPASTAETYTETPPDGGEDRVTISISCATLLSHLEEMEEETAALVPPDGWLLKPTEVELTEGESVFDLLERVCRENNIHMEFSQTPLYNSAYVEGIGNLYEFDCGEQSGWMYAVNDVFPNYGCSGYVLKAGDVVRWEYTRDLGKDIGGDNFAQ